MTGHSERDKVIEGKGRMSDDRSHDQELRVESARERFLKAMAEGVIAGGRLPAPPTDRRPVEGVREAMARARKRGPDDGSGSGR